MNNQADMPDMMPNAATRLKEALLRITNEESGYYEAMKGEIEQAYLDGQRSRDADVETARRQNEEAPNIACAICGAPEHGDPPPGMPRHQFVPHEWPKAHPFYESVVGQFDPAPS
jgi:hypothetical protein